MVNIFKNKEKAIMKRIFDYITDNPLIFIILFIVIIIGVIQPNFLSLYNIINIIRESSLVGIMAIGMTFVIISGGIDLSVGSVMGLSGIIVAMSMKFWNLNVPLSIFLSLMVGVTSGIIAGFLVSKLKVPAFLVTLSLMGILRGLDLIVSKSTPISTLPESFLFIGRGIVFGIPFPSIVFIVLLLIAFLMQRYHTIGRYIYAIGGNYEGSKLTGINVERILFFPYILTGFLAALSGIMYTARLDSAEPMMGTSFELLVIASVCTGGASLMGGRGSLVGTLFGTLLVTVLYNGMALLGLSTRIQEIAVGVLLIAAVSLSIYKKKRISGLA